MTTGELVCEDCQENMMSYTGAFIEAQSRRVAIRDTSENIV